jgi:hypothetical protein
MVRNMMKFSRAISRVKWLSSEKTNVSKKMSVLVEESNKSHMVRKLTTLFSLLKVKRHLGI